MSALVIGDSLISKKIVLCLFSLFVISSSASSGVEVEPGKTDYYYISIFKGYFPIPSSYGVVVPRSEADDLSVMRFSSPVVDFGNLSSADKRRSIGSGSGWIRAGLLGSSADENRLIGGLSVIAEKNMYGLNVKILGVEGGGRSKSNTPPLVMITDGLNYLSILDENDALWIELLKHYGEFNQVKEVGQPQEAMGQVLNLE